MASVRGTRRVRLMPTLLSLEPLPRGEFALDALETELALAEWERSDEEWENIDE